MRKTFFSILLFFHLVSFSQLFKQDAQLPYLDCIQVSPLFFMEPYTTCFNLTWEHHYQPKLYLSGSIGYIFNTGEEDIYINIQEQKGIRLSYDVKFCLSSKARIHPKLEGEFCIGVEPYLKYIKSVQTAYFSIPWEEAKEVSKSSTNYIRDSLSGRYLYTCERKQIGSIFKATLKQSKKRFSLEIEAGFRVLYKIVTQGNVNPRLEYYSPNRHDMYSSYLFEKYDNWALMPFLNLKIGKRF